MRGPAELEITQILIHLDDQPDIVSLHTYVVTLVILVWGEGGGGGGGGGVGGGVFFFFQAEDGIRYLVRSRGLGDVYKRQALLFN